MFNVGNVVPFRLVTLILHNCEKKLLIFTLRAICILQQVVLQKAYCLCHYIVFEFKLRLFQCLSHMILISDGK